MASTVWKGHLTFGLVSLPIRLYSAARAEHIAFNQLHKTDHSRVKQVLYCQLEDRPVPREELVKGYEYEKGRYVVVEDEEIKSAAPATAKTMEILEFVKSSDVDPIFFESSYYVAPEEAGERAYALLFAALRQTGYVAVAKVAMHNREHIVVLRPGPQGVLLHTMYYTDEIRQVEEFRTDTSLVKDKELDLARTLVESLAADFEPQKYQDQYRDNLKSMIKAKVEGRQVVEAPQPETLAPVVDIMEALKASLAKMKKPVRAAETPARAAATVESTTRKKSRKTASGD